MADIIANISSLGAFVVPAATGVAPSTAPFEIAKVLLAIAVIVVAARLVGSLVARFGQPRVMGEIAAGILLGPSFLGAAFPGITDSLFGDVRPTLEVIAKLGLVFFMFLIGLEFDSSLIRGQGKPLTYVFVGSLFTPLIGGITLGFLTHSTLAPEIDRLGYALFLGAALCITAFPVLARLLQEKRLDKTRVGVIALGCAAIEDVCAWLILAVVVAVVRADGAGSFITTFGLTLVFGAAMYFAVRPALAWVVRRLGTDDALSATMLSIVLVGVLLSAWATEEIGIHAIFGAFAFGWVMPRESRLVHGVTLKLEDFTVLLFLPIFFASAGLKTRLASVDSFEILAVGFAILAVAILAKLVPVFVGGRLAGLPKKEAWTLGLLMNTRGLTELVIIAVGKEIGVVNDPMFAILVVVALLTTFMAAPIIEILNRPQQPVFRASHAGLAPGEGPQRVLVALDGSPLDPSLAELAARIAEPTGAALVLSRALEAPERLSRRTTQFGARNAEQDAQGILDRLAERYRGDGFRVETAVETDIDAGLLVCRMAERTEADLVVVGFSRGTLATSPVASDVATILANSPADVAVLVDRSGAGVALERGQTVLVLAGGGAHDRAAIHFAEKLAAVSGSPLRLAARDAAAAEALRAAGAGDEEVVVAVSEIALAEEVARSGVVVVGAGESWALERVAVAGTRARLVAGVVRPAVIVREGAIATDAALDGWLKRARQTQLSELVGRIPEA